MEQMVNIEKRAKALAESEQKSVELQALPQLPAWTDVPFNPAHACSLSAEDDESS
jgi:hypothetical protein